MSPGTRRAGPRPAAAAFVALLLVAVGPIGCGAAAIAERTGGTADYDHGKKAYDQENWLDASLDLKAFVEAYPGTERTDDALFYLGDSYFRMRDYALASGQFDRLLRDFPQSIHEAEARYLLARCDDEQSNSAMLDQTETGRAISRYKEFLELHPEHPRAADAKKRLALLQDKLAEKRYRNGRLYMKLRHHDAADRYFRDVIVEYPTSKWAADAGLLLAESLMKRGRRDEAVATLQAIPGGLARPETQQKIDERRRAWGAEGHSR